MRFFLAPLLAACLSGPMSLVHAVTWHVPTDAPTIQAGIDSASAGDTVLVACGTYYEHDIIMKSGITLLSLSGLPECAAIDAQQLGRVMYCENVDSTSTIQGFTITGGYVSGDSDNGGGMRCSRSAPRIARCIFVSNTSEAAGGGLHCGLSYPKISDCEFRNNTAASKGGGMYAGSTGGPPMNLTNVLFVENSSLWGGGMWCSTVWLTNAAFIGNSAVLGGGGSGVLVYSGTPVFDRVVFYENALHPAMEVNSLGSPSVTNGTFVGNSMGIALFPDAEISLDRTIIAFNAYSVGVATEGATLTCCDIYGNKNGDWVGDIAGQYGINGNISEDPLFCNPDNGDFHLQAGSACAPFTPPNAECDLIGAYPVGCPTTEVADPHLEETSWSSLKALYR